jgi:hypothetical protein
VTAKWPGRRDDVSRGDPRDGVFLYDSYPPYGADPAEVAAWNARFDAWCREHHVDPIELAVLAPDERWDDPY